MSLREHLHIHSGRMSQKQLISHDSHCLRLGQIHESDLIVLALVVKHDTHLFSGASPSIRIPSEFVLSF
jgi:hypothetical protein